jgi:hypothetical protein
MGRRLAGGNGGLRGNVIIRSAAAATLTAAVTNTANWVQCRESAAVPGRAT